MSALEPRAFLGATCTHEARGYALPARSVCGDPAAYLVLDGECPMLACPRHLLDTIEEVVSSSALTVDDEPLGVVRLRETEDD